MTTKFDLLRDLLIDVLNEFNLEQTINVSNNAENDEFKQVSLNEETTKNLVDKMLDVLTDNDIDDVDATNRDFKVKVIVEGRK